MSDYVTFSLGGQDFATRIGEVREVVRLAALVRLPGMTAPVSGVLDLRGRSLPVVDIRPTTGDAAPSGDVLVLGDDETAIGFVCDRVVEVVDEATLVPEELPAGTGSGLPPYVETVLRGPRGPVFLVDVRAMAGDPAPLPLATRTARESTTRQSG